MDPRARHGGSRGERRRGRAPAQAPRAAGRTGRQRGRPLRGDRHRGRPRARRRAGRPAHPALRRAAGRRRLPRAAAALRGAPAQGRGRHGRGHDDRRPRDGDAERVGQARRGGSSPRRATTGSPSSSTVSSSGWSPASTSCRRSRARGSRGPVRSLRHEPGGVQPRLPLSSVGAMALPLLPPCVLGSHAWPVARPARRPRPDPLAMVRAVATVDLGAITRNCERLRAELDGAARLGVVVKADGYGHGARQAAAAALAGGARQLFVATAEEARALGTQPVPVVVMGALIAGGAAGRPRRRGRGHGLERGVRRRAAGRHARCTSSSTPAWGGSARATPTRRPASPRRRRPPDARSPG